MFIQELHTLAHQKVLWTQALLQGNIEFFKLSSMSSTLITLEILIPKGWLKFEWEENGEA